MTEKLISRLCLHAGLPRGTDSQRDLSLALWEWEKSGLREIDKTEVQSYVREIVSILQQVNSKIEISEKTRRTKKRNIDESLSYAVSSILRLLVDAVSNAMKNQSPVETQQTLIAATQNIATSWDMLLAADMKDISVDLRTSNAIKGFITL